MEAKKYPSANVYKYTTLFFNIGLTISLLFVITIFEWKFYDSGDVVELTSDTNDFNEVLDVPITEQPPPPPPKIQNINVIEVPDVQEIEEEIEIDIDIEMTEETVIEEVQEVVMNLEEEEEEVADEIFTIVEEKPMPVGGYHAFYKYVNENLHYPNFARRLGIQGKVFVQFVVDEKGNITNVEIIKGLEKDCDAEALRVVSEAPKWIPGKQRGNPVKVRMVLPVTFMLKDQPVQ